MNENNEKAIPEWHNIADVSVQRICDNSIYRKHFTSKSSKEKGSIRSMVNT